MTHVDVTEFPSFAELERRYGGDLEPSVWADDHIWTMADVTLSDREFCLLWRHFEETGERVDWARWADRQRQGRARLADTARESWSRRRRRP